MRHWGVVVAVGISLLASCGSRRKEVVVAQVGTMIPQAGIVVDVDYDPRLDYLVPGYKIVIVAIDNNTLNPLRLDVKKDRWFVQDARGRWVGALHNLKQKKQRLWRQLPHRVRQSVDYPEIVSVGETGVVDLFVPKSVSLEGFRGIRFDSASLGRILDVQREP